MFRPEDIHNSELLLHFITPVQCMQLDCGSYYREHKQLSQWGWAVCQCSLRISGQTSTGNCPGSSFPQDERAVYYRL